jgi:HD superfamily phosphohydrolase
MKKSHFHVMKDPVHGTMQFTEEEDRWIKPFIDSKGMQRLRHIKQLGFADYIFPGAVHTRFNHSLGCCYVGSQIAHKIELPAASRQLVMIACLLHDIGHGPFSHAFEGLFDGKLIHHEAWTPYFLSEYTEPTFFDAYNAMNPKAKLNEDQFSEIIKMIMHQPVQDQLLADIVSSQLDADRLDYLLRDSHFCGVRYGQFDFRWMIHCLAIVNHEGKPHLGITEKGVGVFESYLMARRMIMRNIGHSTKKLAIEKLLVDLLGLLSTSLVNESLFSEVKSTRLGRFLLAVHQFNMKVKKTNQPDRLKDDFLKNQFKEYRELCDYDVYRLIRHLADKEEKHPVIDIAKRIQCHDMPQIMRLENYDSHNVIALVDDFLNENQDILPWQIQWMASPHKSYTEHEPVLVSDEEGKIRPITDYSLMIHMLSDQSEKVEFLMIDKAIINDNRINALVKKVREFKLENTSFVLKSNSLETSQEVLTEA